MSSLSTRPSAVKNIAKRAILAKRPLFIWGPPGIGKSDIVFSLADELPGNNAVVDLRLALMEPTDLRGFPFRNPETNLMEFSPPEELPTFKFASQYDLIILFLDELNSAPPSVQAAAYQLTLNRRIGNYHLPDNVVILAAGNREGDRGVTYRMPKPLANRFRHVTMEVNFDDFNSWAVKNDFSAETLGFLAANKSLLFKFDPKSDDNAFPTPRSWKYVSDAVKIKEFNFAPENEQQVEIAGCVGDGVAISYVAHRKVGKHLPRAEDVVDGVVKELSHELANEISARYSLVIGVCYELHTRYKESPNEKFKTGINHACRFAFNNLQAEMVIMMLTVLMQDYNCKFSLRDTMDKDNLDVLSARYAKYLRPQS